MDAVDAVHSGCSGIVVYGGWNIVFDTKRSNHSRQWMQWNSDRWWWGHCLWCKKVKPVDSVDAVTQWTQYTGCSMQWMEYAVYAVCSGIVLYGGGDIVFDTKWSNQWTQYAVDAVE